MMPASGAGGRRFESDQPHDLIVLQLDSLSINVKNFEIVKLITERNQNFRIMSNKKNQNESELNQAQDWRNLNSSSILFKLIRT